jgi:DNA polymerase I
MPAEVDAPALNADSDHRLFDGMALVYRAHFAFIRNPIRTSRGVNTSAIYGLATALLDLIENHRPTHLALVLDTPEPTFRHREFPAYKAHRDEMPEELAAAMPDVPVLAAAFRIPVLAVPGYEADDVIGTLVAKAVAAPEHEVFMVTPDKDFAQLVGPQAKIFKPARQAGEPEILGLEEVCQAWGIERPDQVIDVLGLMGDASDNIPGIPGVGEKTAKKLISEFGSIEGLLAHTDKLKGKQKGQRRGESRTGAPLEKARHDHDRRSGRGRLRRDRDERAQRRGAEVALRRVRVQLPRQTPLR